MVTCKNRFHKGEVEMVFISTFYRKETEQAFNREKEEETIVGKTVIVSAVRTPFGKLGGSVSGLKAAELGGAAIQAASKGRTEIDSVIMGCVLQGGQGQLPSRQAMHYAGLPWQVETETINKVCASGMRSITTAD